VTVTGTCGNPSAVTIDQATAGNGFTVQASNVTIECLKLRLGGGSYYGIDNTGLYDSLHVSNVVVRAEEYGVFSPGMGTNGLSITGSTFLGMVAGAVTANTVSNATITGNTFGNTEDNCVFVTSLSNSTVSNNTFSTCGHQAFETDTGTSNTISGNKITTAAGTCIYVESAATTITKNTITGCNSEGIYVDAGTPTITSNTFSGEIGGDVIEVDCGNNSTVSGNTATGGTNNGRFIFVCQQSGGGSETITNNTEMAGPALYGIFCPACDGALVTGNKILGGGNNYGIDVVGLDPTVNQNTVAGGWNSEGIHVSCTGSCLNAQVEKNVESGANTGNGILVVSSGCSSFPCMTISGNTSSGNKGTGFYLGAPFANVTGNTATGNGFTYTGCSSSDSGFDVEANGAHLSGNTASGNICDGFFVNGPSTTVSTNTATGNLVHGFQVAANLDLLDHDTATGNMGDGFNNDGTNTSFTNDKASGNRQDCTNDTGESATLGSILGSTCADHTNFGVASTLTGW
jgi:parallel beta-helix repeat protein